MKAKQPRHEERLMGSDEDSRLAEISRPQGLMGQRQRT
jgi:hypothetical protein